MGFNKNGVIFMDFYFRDFCEELYESNARAAKLIKAGLSTVAGSGVGGGVVTASGLTAAGMVGGPVIGGIGCAAFTVGIVAGGLIGLSAYGVKKLLED